MIASDESNNPYVDLSTSGNSLNHGIGVITSLDAPSSVIPNVAGVLNREYQELDHFREFARVNLQGLWFRISDYVEWRFEMKVKFNGTKWQNDNNGSFPVPTP